MRVYTKTGDKGKTQIFGGIDCDKDHIRIEANGQLDEASAFIGQLRAKLPDSHAWQDLLKTIQIDLMDTMSHVATHSSHRDKNTVRRPETAEKYCEEWIDKMLDEMPKPHDWFILPGGNEVSALCHVVRTQMRRAERSLVTLNREDPLEGFIIRFVNRLSDLFFVMSRYELYQSNLDEEKLRKFRLSPIK